MIINKLYFEEGKKIAKLNNIPEFFVGYYAKGYAIGYTKGLAKGLAKGEAKGILNVLSSSKVKLSIAEIAEIFMVTEEFIKEIIAEQTTSELAILHPSQRS